MLHLFVKLNKELPTKHKQIENMLSSSISKSNAPSLNAWKEQIWSISSDSKDFKRKIHPLIKSKLMSMNYLQNTSHYQWKNTSILDKLLQADQGNELCKNKNDLQSELPSDIINELSVTSKGNDASIILVDTKDKLSKVAKIYPFQKSIASNDIDPTASKIVAVDCEGVPFNLFLVQIATTDGTFVLDGVKLGFKTVCKFLRPMLQNGAIVKYFHDLSNDVAAFSRIGGIHSFSGTFDTQLACKYKTGKKQMGFNKMLELFGCPTHPTKNLMSRRITGGFIFRKRPLAPEVLAYAVDDVKLLVAVHECIRKSLGEEIWLSVQSASDAKANATSEVKTKLQL